MLIIRYLFALTIFLQAQNCEDKSNTQSSDNTEQMVNDSAVNSITVQHHGGMMAHQEVMVIDSKKIVYTFSNISNPKPQTQEEATPKELWNLLLTNFDEQKFSNLKDGSSHMVYDGTDEIYVITGSFGELKIRNPLDANQEMKTFFETLNAKRYQFYMNVQNK